MTSYSGNLCDNATSQFRSAGCSVLIAEKTDLQLAAASTNLDGVLFCVLYLGGRYRSPWLSDRSGTSANDQPNRAGTG